jgi:hypothetical protein
VESNLIKSYKDACFPIGLTDAAAFNQTLANLAVQLRNYRAFDSNTTDYEMQEAITRHLAALSLVRKKISNPSEATSYGTIATIVALLCYAVRLSNLALACS